MAWWGWVYEIRNTVTGRVYIGSTQYINTRLHQHRNELYHGHHYNKSLQEDWDTYGGWSFTMTVLEEMWASCDDLHFDRRLRRAERHHVARAEMAGGVYNIHPVVPGLGDWQKRAGYDVSHRGRFGPGRVDA